MQPNPFAHAVAQAWWSQQDAPQALQGLLDQAIDRPTVVTIARVARVVAAGAQIVVAHDRVQLNPWIVGPWVAALRSPEVTALATRYVEAPTEELATDLVMAFDVARMQP